MLKSGSALQQSVEALREEGSPGSPTGGHSGPPEAGRHHCSASLRLYQRALQASAGRAPPKASLPGGFLPGPLSRVSSSQGLSPGPVHSRALSVSSQSSLGAHGCSQSSLGARWCSNLFLEGSLDQGPPAARPHFTFVTSSTALSPVPPGLGLKHAYFVGGASQC